MPNKSDVRDALDQASYACYGFFSSEPEPCTNCTANPTLTWNFGSYTQANIDNKVPVLLWQFAETIGCWGSTCNTPGYANGQNLDSCTSGSTPAENYMLVIS